MSTFDESKIHRGQPANAGQFAAKHHSAPSVGLSRALDQSALLDRKAGLEAVSEGQYIKARIGGNVAPTFYAKYDGAFQYIDGPDDGKGMKPRTADFIAENSDGFELDE